AGGDRQAGAAEHPLEALHQVAVTDQPQVAVLAETDPHLVANRRVGCLFLGRRGSRLRWVRHHCRVRPRGGGGTAGNGRGAAALSRGGPSSPKSSGGEPWARRGQSRRREGMLVFLPSPPYSGERGE